MNTIYKVNGKRIKITPKGKLAEKYNLSEAERNQLRIMYLDRLEKEIEKSYDKAKEASRKIDFIGTLQGCPDASWTLHVNYTRPLEVVYSKRNLYDFATGLYNFFSTLKKREAAIFRTYAYELYKYEALSKASH
jgi:hypothetical protein